MADPTVENALKAMRKAYDAGDMESAKRMAALAKSLQGAPQGRDQNGFLGQVNAGIADTAGGLVDFINPFSRPVWDDVAGGKLATGSAKEGLRQGMQAIGADVATDAPDGFVEGGGRGLGQAAGALIPTAGIARAVSTVGGIAGPIARDVYTSLASKLGVATDAAAGAVSGAAGSGARSAGAPEWVAQTAEVLAPMAALPAAAYVATRGPVVKAGRAASKAAGRAVAPFTEAGGREIARQRIQQLAGGEDRARELARSINPADEFGLSPAQQTGDPNMLGLEQAAGRVAPELRARTEAGIATADQNLRGAVAGAGGDPEAARAFIAQRRQDFTARLEKAADDAIKAATTASPKRGEIDNSLTVSRTLGAALDNAELQERALWEAVPNDTFVPTSATKSAIEKAVNVSRFRTRDIPQAVRDAMDGDKSLKGYETVMELHGLYSELRRVARSAMAGNDQNKNTARIANEVAEAVLKDLGAVDAKTTVGQKINEAREFSRVLHETFDRGAVGRLLKRTLDGDVTIDPELSLERTVGQGGVSGAVASRQIRTAAPGGNTADAIQDYLRSRFQRSAFGPDGAFNQRAAQKFIRDNETLLAQNPKLRVEIQRAAASQQNAARFVKRAETVGTALDNPAKSVGAAFLNGTPEDAVSKIFSGANPARSAAEIVRQARKDTTGAALEGVKGAASRYLMAQSTKPSGGAVKSSGQDFVATVNKNLPALRQIFKDDEIQRLQRIGFEMVKLDRARVQAPDIGNLTAAKPNKMIEMLLRIQAAKYGAQVAGRGSGAIQIPGMFSERARSFLQDLTSDKATAILLRAVEDPALFRDLLTDAPTIKLQERIINRMGPYIAGGGAAMTGEDE